MSCRNLVRLHAICKWLVTSWEIIATLRMAALSKFENGNLFSYCTLNGCKKSGKVKSMFIRILFDTRLAETIDIAEYDWAWNI